MPSFQHRPVGRPPIGGSPDLQGGPPGGGRGNDFLQEQLRNRQDQGSSQDTHTTVTLQTSPDGIPQQYASKSATWKTGYKDGLAQAKGGLANIQADAKTQGALAKASQKTGVAHDDLTAMSIIESTGNRNVGTNAFGYTGLMQMGRDAAADVGMSYGSLLGGANVDNNALAGAKYWNLNEERLDPGIPRDPLHMYLAHQQGAGGTNDLMKTLKTSPGSAANSAQKNNLPDKVRKSKNGKTSQQDFYDYWAGKMQGIQDSIAASRS